MRVIRGGVILATTFVVIACDGGGSPTEPTDPDGSFTATLSGEVNATITEGVATFATNAVASSAPGFAMGLGDGSGDYVIGVNRHTPGLLAEGTYTISGDFVAYLGGSEVGLIYDLAGATLTVTSSSSTTLEGTIVGTGRFTGADGIERQVQVNGSFVAACTVSGGCP